MNWISVKDQLPKEGVKVLVYGSQEIDVDYLLYLNEEKDGDYVWAGILMHDWQTITHWMELPEKPLEKHEMDIEDCLM